VSENRFPDEASRLTPFWLRESVPAEVNRIVYERDQLERLHAATPPPSKAPNPLARSWHDL